MSLEPARMIVLSVEKRALLRRKGEILYGKSCGIEGDGLCAESFARFQLKLGHVEVIDDLIAYLERQVALLERDDPHQRLSMTMSLLDRIRDLRANES